MTLRFQTEELLPVLALLLLMLTVVVLELVVAQLSLVTLLFFMITLTLLLTLTLVVQLRFVSKTVFSAQRLTTMSTLVLQALSSRIFTLTVLLMLTSFALINLVLLLTQMTKQLPTST